MWEEVITLEENIFITVAGRHYYKLNENLAPFIDQSLLPEKLKTDTRPGRSEGLRL